MNTVSFFCVIDTETSDLPNNDGRIIELAWKIFDHRGNPLIETSRIINPSGEWKMSEKAQSIHGISKEDVQTFGSSPIEVFHEFITDISEYASKLRIVGHNISFDMEMLKKDFEKEGIHDNIDFIPTVCTQRLGCKYLGMKEDGRLSLESLHRKLFGIGVAGAHGALDDVNATARCFMKIEQISQGVR